MSGEAGEELDTIRQLFDELEARENALRLLDAAPPPSSTDVARGDPILQYRSPRSLDPYEDDAIVVRSDGGVFLR